MRRLEHYYDDRTERIQLEREGGEVVRTPIGKPVEHSNILALRVSENGQA